MVIKTKSNTQEMRQTSKRNIVQCPNQSLPSPNPHLPQTGIPPPAAPARPGWNTAAAAADSTAASRSYSPLNTGTGHYFIFSKESLKVLLQESSVQMRVTGRSVTRCERKIRPPTGGERCRGFLQPHSWKSGNLFCCCLSEESVF